MIRPNKFTWRSLCLSAVVVCILVGVIFIATIPLRVSPARLIGTYIFLRSILTQKPAPMLPPDDLFRKHVLDPIPQSVTDIRADRPKKYRGYTYTLRFKIDRPDVALLINAGSLKRVWNVKYKNGYLFWAWDTLNGFSLNGIDIIVYHPDGPPEPTWFKPELWEDSEAYAFSETTDCRITNTKVLLFNEKEGEAYFIVERMK